MSKRKSQLILNRYGLRLHAREDRPPREGDVITRETVLTEFPSGVPMGQLLRAGQRWYEDNCNFYDEINVRTTDGKLAIVGVEQVYPVAEEDPDYWRGLFYSWIASECGEEIDTSETLKDLRTRKKKDYSRETDESFQLGQEHMNLYIEEW
jgi:hypothetical protein